MSNVNLGYWNDFKFYANGTWDHSWGVNESYTTTTLGKDIEAVYNGNYMYPFYGNDTYSNKDVDVHIIFDTRNFNYGSKKGVKFRINVNLVGETSEEASTEETTEDTIESEPAETDPSEEPSSEEPSSEEPSSEEPSSEEPTEPSTEEPIFNGSKFVVAGVSELTGVTWVGDATKAPQNVMTYDPEQELFVITYTIEPTKKGLQFKIVENTKDGVMYWIGDESGNNFTFDVIADESKEQDYTVTITYNPLSKEVTITGNFVEMPQDLEIDAMYVAGNGSDAWLNGVAWNPAADENKMTEISENVYQIEMSGVYPGYGYEFKFAANGSWADNWGYAGGTIEFGKPFDAIYNSNNLKFDIENKDQTMPDSTTYTVTMTIDLNGFNYNTKTGGTITIDVAEENPAKLVRVALPKGKNAYSTWDWVELYYGNTDKFEEMNKVDFFNLGETAMVTSVGTSTALKTGGWDIFASWIGADVAKEIESAKFVGFNKGGSGMRTHIYRNVLFAPDEYEGSYNKKARTIAELSDRIFVIQDTISVDKASNTAFVGEWKTPDELVAPETVTIKFAAPKSCKAVYDWSNGVELYYGSADNYKDTDRIELTATDETMPVSVEGTNLETLASGDWVVYSVTLTQEQIYAISDSDNIGFIKKGSFNRTSFMMYRNIFRAGKNGNGYDYFQNSIFDYDGYTFVIDGHYPTSSEGISYTGSWVK